MLPAIKYPIGYHAEACTHFIDTSAQFCLDKPSGMVDQVMGSLSRVSERGSVIGEMGGRGKRWKGGGGLLEAAENIRGISFFSWVFLFRFAIF